MHASHAARRSRTTALLDGPTSGRWAPLKWPVFAIIAGTIAVTGALSVRGDVQLSRDLAERGIVTEGQFQEVECGKGCSALPVTFRTLDGQEVTTDVVASGDPDDDTILIRYDPRDPRRAQPANGVREDELTAGLFGTAAAGACVAFSVLTVATLRRQLRADPTGGVGCQPSQTTSPSSAGHVRLLP